jgi:hypothetical protein
VSYFTAVRLYSIAEVCVFSALLVVAIGGLGEDLERVLGWTHGVGWILLCLLVAYGCRRRIFPWPLLAATVSPLGPVGSTAGIEYLVRRRAGEPESVSQVGGPWLTPAPTRRSVSSSRLVPRR